MIEKALIQDAGQLAELVNSAYRGETSRQGWTTEADLLDGTRTDEAALNEMLRKPDVTILKYTDQGNLLGCVELRMEKGKLYLGMLTVRPNLQGRGIGKELLKAAEAEAKSQKCSAIFMTVISVRKELIDWYVRHGYQMTGERKPFSFTDPRFGQPKMKLEFIVLEKQIR